MSPAQQAERALPTEHILKTKKAIQILVVHLQGDSEPSRAQRFIIRLSIFSARRTLPQAVVVGSVISKGDSGTLNPYARKGIYKAKGFKRASNRQGGALPSGF